MSKQDFISKIGPLSGIMVFFIGVALLVFTFYNTLTLLLHPERLTAFLEVLPAISGQDGGLSVIVTMIRYVVVYLIPILLIFALGYIASKITAHGIQMYRSRVLTTPREEKVKREELES